VDEKGNIMAGSGGHVAGVKRTNSDMQQVRVGEITAPAEVGYHVDRIFGHGASGSVHSVVC
jgi:hypothetical protein